MISDDVQRIELEARTRALEEYKLRCQDLRSTNDALHKEKDEREMDALQVIAFLRTDGVRKDDLIESLKNTINQQRDVFNQQREGEIKEAEERYSQMETELRGEIDELSIRLNVSDAELLALHEFKVQKTAIEEAMAKGERERERMEADHKEDLATMERKLYEEKGRLQKEYKQMLAEMKKTSQEEAVERLDASTKKILFENRRMAEELRLQIGETDELQKSNQSLAEENKRLKRELQLNEQAVKEYAKQGFRQSKEIKELTARLKSLERYVSSSAREFEKEKEQLSQADKKKTAEAELDSAALRQLLRLKTKELAHMKKLAAVILQKRNEVETFLLEAIEHVKVEVGRRRAEEERSGRSLAKRLPALGAPPRPSSLPHAAEERVDIRELTWEDRERVLRLLFAKINNAGPFTEAPPPHGLDPTSPMALREEVARALASGPEASLSGIESAERISGEPAFFVTQPEVA